MVHLVEDVIALKTSQMQGHHCQPAISMDILETLELDLGDLNVAESLPNGTQTFDLDDLRAAEYILNEHMDAPVSLNYNSSRDSRDQFSLGCRSFHPDAIINTLPNESDLDSGYDSNSTMSPPATVQATEYSPGWGQVIEYKSEFSKVTEDKDECNMVIGEEFKCNEVMSSGGSNKKDRRPKETYVALIAKAMLASRKTKLKVGEIFDQVRLMIIISNNSIVKQL